MLLQFYISKEKSKDVKVSDMLYSLYPYIVVHVTSKITKLFHLVDRTPCIIHARALQNEPYYRPTKEISGTGR